MSNPRVPGGVVHKLPGDLRNELVEQLVRPDDLSVDGSDPFGQSTVGRDHDHVAIGLGDGGDRVVGIAGRMHNLHAAHVRLLDHPLQQPALVEEDRRIPRREGSEPVSSAPGRCRLSTVG